MIQSILDSLNAIVANPYFVALGLSLVISLAGTQWLKFRLVVPERFAAYHRWWVRVISLPLGFFPAFLLWPGTKVEAAMWGLAAAFSGPFVYKVFMSTLYKFFPHLEDKASANPWRLDE